MTDFTETRSMLKKLGLLRFNRTGWVWMITPEGRAALAAKTEVTL